MPNYSKSIIYKLECKDHKVTEIYVGATTDFYRRKNNHKQKCINKDGKVEWNEPKYRFMRLNGGWNNWNMLVIEEVNARNKRHLNQIEAKYIRELKAELNCFIPQDIDEGLEGKEWRKEYRAKNSEKLAEKSKEYRAKNAEKIAQNYKEYHEKNREKIAEQRKGYYEKNREKLAEKMKKYYEKNREKLAEKSKEYHEKNREKIAEQRKGYYAKNREKIAAKNKENRAKNAANSKKYRAKNAAKISEKMKVKVKCECGVEITKKHLLRHKRTQKHQDWVNRPEPNLIFVD